MDFKGSENISISNGFSSPERISGHFTEKKKKKGEMPRSLNN